MERAVDKQITLAGIGVAVKSGGPLGILRRGGTGLRGVPKKKRINQDGFIDKNTE